VEVKKWAWIVVGMLAFLLATAILFLRGYDTIIRAVFSRL
jgi:hypothetical protein